MATLISSANGNFTAAGTWKVADSASLLDSVVNQTATTTSYVASQTFVPGAITIDGFAVNLASRVASPVGTFSVELYNSTDAVSVQIVTVNVSDLSAKGGWHVCSFASILLLAGKSYSIRVKSSTTGEVTVYRNATVANWSRMLRTTTTAAPGAGDNFVVVGQFTGAGAFSAYQVTMDNTSTTVFGTISAAAPACSVSSKGSLVWGNAASTNYKLRIAGGLIVSGSGVHTISTVGSPMPITSTAVLDFVITTNVDGGLEVGGAATFTAVGTQLRTVNRCFLNADAAATATTLTTDVATGWKAGDQIAIATTSRTLTQGERFILGVDASGTTVTLPSGLAYAHSGSTGRQAEIINLTRNVVIKGNSTSLCGYVWIRDGATVDCRQVEFSGLGSGTVGKKGVEFDSLSNLPNFEDCSLHDFYSVGTSAIGLHQNGAGAGSVAKRCDFWGAGYIAVYYQTQPGAVGSLVEDCWVVGNGSASSYGMQFNGSNTAATGNRISGVATSFNYAMGTANPIGTCANNVVHSCTAGPSFTGVVNSESTGNICWRTGGQGYSVSTCTNFHLEITESVGHASSSISVGTNKRTRIKILSAKGETGYTQPYSIYVAGTGTDTIVYDSVFGNASAPGAATNGDIVTTAAGADLIFQNCQFLSPTEFYVSTWGYAIGYRSETHQGVAGNNKYVRWEGTMLRDTSIYDAGGTASLRMTPTQAAVKMRSEPAFTTSVLSGGTATPSVRIRKSVVGDGTAYNGNQPRLMLRANPVAGISSDTVIATCAGAAGSWETVTGVTPAAAENTRFEFYVDCDGTTGWINVDNCTIASDVTSAMDIWNNGTPYVIGALSLSNFTDVDQDKVELGYAYKYNSSVNNRTGTRRQPTTSEVKIGVAYGPSDSLTGTYVAAERYSDPGIANVRLGTAYQFNSLTNNRTGDVTIPTTSEVKIGVTYDTVLSLTGTYVAAERYSDPGIANVRNGTAYQFNSLTNNRTGDVTIPVTNEVKIGVTYDTLLTLTGTYVAAERYSDPGVGTVEVGTQYQFNSLTNNRTGTYDGSNRWTDPGDANVRYSTAYKANSLTNNKTGRLVSPATNTVLAGIGYDTDGATTGTLTAPSASTIATAVWTQVLEGALTAEQIMRLNSSILNGKVSGAGTGTEVFRDLGDTKDRVIVTTDTAGNRTAIVRDGT